MIEKYPLRDEPGKTMFIFEKHGKYYGNIVKDKTASAHAKLLSKFDSVEKLKEEYSSV